MRAVDVRAVGTQMHFTVLRRNGVTLPDLEVVLNLPGEHNVLNALATSPWRWTELNVPDEAVLRAWLASPAWAGAFSAWRAAAGRRALHLIEDYGHHPVEMAATWRRRAGVYPGRRLVLAFQPHRYSRTRDCFEDFVRCWVAPTPCC